MKKRILLFIAVLITGGVLFIIWTKLINKLPDQVLKNSVQTEDLRQESIASNKLRLVATGDMIAHDSINANAKKADGTYDYLQLMDQMKPYFDKSDVSFCNQATPSGGESFKISGYPVFNAPIEFARGIEGVGCNVINIGTNHTNDKGQGLIDATIAAWDGRPNVLAVAGANKSTEEKNKIKYFTKGGIKFSFLSYVTYTNVPITNGYGVTMYEEAFAKNQVQEARRNSDFVIVSMRWGTEYSATINTSQDKIAQNLSDFGADIIFGHGPHTLQPIKKLSGKDGRETFAWFSLGNFLNSQLDIGSLINGLAIMDIDLTSKKITNISFMPVYQHYEWTAAQKTSNDLLARKNFELVPLDRADDLLAKSLNNTTVSAQQSRVSAVLNKYLEIPIISSKQF